MRRQKTKWRTFYVPDKKRVGSGVEDSEHRVYIVEKGGNLRLIKDRKRTKH